MQPLAVALFSKSTIEILSSCLQVSILVNAFELKLKWHLDKRV